MGTRVCDSKLGVERIEEDGKKKRKETGKKAAARVTSGKQKRHVIVKRPSKRGAVRLKKETKI